MDIAFPAKHNCALYGTFKQQERSKPIGAAPSRNGTTQWTPLPDWRVVDSELWACGPAKGTVENFLFRCTRWGRHSERRPYHRQTEEEAALAFYLGGKAASDPETWTPKRDATIKFAVATGRLGCTRTAEKYARIERLEFLNQARRGRKVQ